VEKRPVPWPHELLWHPLPWPAALEAEVLAQATDLEGGAGQLHQAAPEGRELELKLFFFTLGRFPTLKELEAQALQG
jgi:hypothetical protein